MSDAHSPSGTGHEPVRGRSLLPREHGAYVQLAFSLSTALALGKLRSAQLLLTVAASAAFLAHEPVVVMLGERGGRAYDQVKERATRAAAALLAIAAIAGVAGWLGAPPLARGAVLLPLFLAALLVRLIFTRREKTATGELLLALTFSSALIPVALAGGVAPRPAAIASVVWALVFLVETFAARGVRNSAKEARNLRRPFGPALLSSAAAVVAVSLLSAAGVLPVLAGAAVLPAALIAVACGMLRIHPRHLRAIGWSFAASNLLAFAALLLALR
jgi:hypothetical protein